MNPTETPLRRGFFLTGRTKPVFVPLGGRSGSQCLSRLAGVRESSVYPAWRASGKPVFVPLGGRQGTQCLTRLAGVREASICPAWRAFGKPVFVPLGACPGAQCLSRLARVREASVYPAWRLQRPCVRFTHSAAVVAGWRKRWHGRSRRLGAGGRRWARRRSASGCVRAQSRR